MLALGVAALAHRMLQALAFPVGYAALLMLGAALLLASALFFVSAREPRAPQDASIDMGFVKFLHGAGDVVVNNRRFRLFLFAQWLGGTAAIALPFYVLQMQRSEADIAFLLGAQTAGALASNPVWGWWGDRRGKRELLEIVSAAGVMAPVLTLAWIASDGRWGATALPYFALVFVLLGAVGNGGTIAYLGYLMEISPNDRRPAYSGYFNALAAPAAMLPWAGGAIAQAQSFAAVFALSAAVAMLQFLIVRRLR